MKHLFLTSSGKIPPYLNIADAQFLRKFHFSIYYIFSIQFWTQLTVLQRSMHNFLGNPKICSAQFHSLSKPDLYI